VPWIGYPFVMDGGWLVLAGIALGALVLALVAGRRPAPKPVGQLRTRQPVG
jgi:hypothetical protein